jgi:hypothetical protein
VSEIVVLEASATGADGRARDRDRAAHSATRLHLAAQ